LRLLVQSKTNSLQFQEFAMLQLAAGTLPTTECSTLCLKPPSEPADPAKVSTSSEAY
jgi:hypothetical protein